MRYTGAKTYLVGLGYTDSAKKSITITFDERGIYDLADIEVLEQPVDDAKAQIAALSADTMQNVQMRANAITGTVDLKETKILCLSIPYSNGWTATVDGKKAELLQANTAFSALALEPGKHTVELHYHTPYLRTGRLSERRRRGSLCRTDRHHRDQPKKEKTAPGGLNLYNRRPLC